MKQQINTVNGAYLVDTDAKTISGPMLNGTVDYDRILMQMVGGQFIVELTGFGQKWLGQIKYVH